MPTAPIISVVLPTYCSVKDISRAIDSVLAQTYTDWELLVVNDFGSDDGTAEIVKMYADNDKRIRLIQADTRLGLAESLNLGIREANGKYIARLDADDTAFPERFARQVEYLELHPEIGVCGTWQYHYSDDSSKKPYVHQAAPDPRVLKCRLLFWCDLCHSTLMLRRDTFIQNNLFYDSEALAEDFELWTRAIEFTGIVNLPEVLGDYNEGTGITAKKIQQLNEESGRIAARTIKRVLNIDIPLRDCRLLNSWVNPISNGAGRKEELNRLKEILTSIWVENEKVNYYDSKILLNTLAAKWYWAKDNVNWQTTDYNVKNVTEAFSDKHPLTLLARYKAFCENNPELHVRIKKIFKRLLRPVADLLRKITYKLMRDVIEAVVTNVTASVAASVAASVTASVTADVMKEIRASEERLSNGIANRMAVQKASCIPYTPYINGEKVRILFLFQAASFWPSWESFYKACISDERIDVEFSCLDELYGDTTQMHTAKSFLSEQGIDYKIYSDTLFAEFNPHVIVMQTPYDQWHRSEHVRSISFRNRGARIIYIPYGIEITDTVAARKDQFLGDVVNLAWRVYTFSDKMVIDYKIYTQNGNAVRCFGHPKFDGLYEKKVSLPDKIKTAANGRKIILWHVHFPKHIPLEDGSIALATPYLEEYLAFVKYAITQTDFFFVLQTHPKFLDCGPELRSVASEILRLAEDASNIWWDSSDDYRSTLLNADYIISDRSAIMVEAAAVQVPILYMHNPNYYEPITKAIQPLVESYYKGTCFSDMKKQLDVWRNGDDPKKEERMRAFTECIPYFDGKCGERIKDDILLEIYSS